MSRVPRVGNDLPCLPGSGTTAQFGDNAWLIYYPICSWKIHNKTGEFIEVCLLDYVGHDYVPTRCVENKINPDKTVLVTIVTTSCTLYNIHL